MITVEDIQKLVEEKIQGTDLFIVEIKVDAGNNISVSVDAPNGFDVKHCIEISKHIEGSFDRDEEDFALEVASSGIGYPFKVLDQYKKTIGGTIEVLFVDGKKIEGKLLDANEDVFSIEYEVKEKIEGAKRPKMVNKQLEVKYDETKTVKETITF